MAVCIGFMGISTYSAAADIIDIDAIDAVDTVKIETKKEKSARIKAEKKAVKDSKKIVVVAENTVKKEVVEAKEMPLKEVSDLQKQEWAQLRKKIEQAKEQKRFDTVEELILKVPTEERTEDERFMWGKIQIFKAVEKEEKEESSMFRKETALDARVVASVKRLYQGGQAAILNKKDSLAKDMLIQSLFLDRGNYKAKKLLEKALGLPVGSYLVEDVEAKYWKTSLINFYSGYPEKAVEDLKVLEYFAPQNPDVFKRMGSAYYSMGETTLAVQSWKRALYLDDKDEKLKEFIKSATEEIDNQSKDIKEQLARRDKVKAEKKAEGDAVTLGVYRTATQAYSFAQEVREKQKGANVEVVEQEDGRWAVQIIKNSGKKEAQ